MASACFRDRFALPQAVTSVGHIPRKTDVVRGRSLDSFALVWVVSGQGFYADALHGRQAVLPGSVLWLRPEVTQDYGPDPGTTWDEWYAVFHGPVFDALADAGLFAADHPVTHLGADPALTAVLVDLDRRLRAPAIDQLWCVARMHIALVDIAARARHPQRAFLQAAEQALAADISGSLRLAIIAQQFDLSEQVFRKRFAQLAGLPPAQWRQKRRLERAKTLLLTTPQSLAVIATELGWCDAFFFSRQFKHATGQTPSQFRNAFRGHPNQPPLNP